VAQHRNAQRVHTTNSRDTAFANAVSFSSAMSAPENVNQNPCSRTMQDSGMVQPFSLKSR